VPRPRRSPRIRVRLAWLGLALALAASDANAIFIVNQPWLRPAANGKATEVYMDLTSTEGAALVGVRSDAAASALIRPPGSSRSSVERLTLPAGALVRLAAGGYRIVLSDLKQSVKLGDRVTLSLTIEGADGARREIAVNAEARKRSPLEDERRTHSH
jgi:copper(I)-binding protein